MAERIDETLARRLVPQRPADGHKGSFGHVFVVAGSPGFTGGAVLACRAAGRSGAGLVTLGIPESLSDAITPMLLETMSHALPSTLAGTFSKDATEPALTFAASKDAAVLGPGISQHEGTREFVRAFVGRCPVSLVIDADGLNCLVGATDSLVLRQAPTVLTPHPGEMARLRGVSVAEVQAQRENVAVEFARRFRCVVVLKGAGTVVANADGACRVNTTGNSGMATGGTGDVLAGMIGALLAQGVNPFDAASLGVYAHGLAGDLAAEIMTGRGMIAGDVIDQLPAAWRQLEGGTGS